MEDMKIIELYWARNEAAIPATADKYGKYCHSIAQNILKNNEDTAECVNDTYWQAWNAMPPARPQLLAAFLGKITRNLSLNRYRRRYAHKRGGGQIPMVLDELSELLSGNESVEQESEYRELIAAINGFLAALPMEKRCIFVCRYWYCESISDIADRFGMTDNNVSVNLNRLRSKLHKYLTERGFEL